MTRGIVKIIVDDSDDTADGPETNFDKVAAEIESWCEGEAEKGGVIGVNEKLEEDFEDCGQTESVEKDAFSGGNISVQVAAPPSRSIDRC